MDYRIHILGASGSGKTTLAHILSERLNIPHFDTDDYRWVKTTIPYTEKTDESKRSEALKTDLLKYPQWVLSGSMPGWGDFAITMFTLGVFLWVPTDLRLSRIHKRDVERYGLYAISPGGWFHRQHEEFMSGESAYDRAGTDVSYSRAYQEQWASRVSCPVLKIEGEFSTEELSAKVEHELNIMEHN